MNKKINKKTAIGSIVALATMIGGAALPAFALSAGLNASATVNVSGTGVGVNAGVGANAALAARIKNITSHADQEIDRRIAALNTLSTRVNAMAKISADEKNNLSAAIQTQINALTALKATIASDAAANSTTSLKTDVQSITGSYRIFALVLPQASIEAASDRAQNIATTMTDLATKFSARISAASTAGNNVSAASAALADFNAKVSDGNVQAQAAATEVAKLTPDNGDKTLMASNTAALKDAHAKISAAQADFVAARADAQTIIKELGKFKMSASATATTTTSVH